ncbi:MAG: hypothetical protein WBW48_21760 [Anaerolineae bacterium]
MIQRVVEEFERRSVHLAPTEEDEIRHLLREYEPVLRFHEGERFLPMSAILYLLFSTLWYIPLKSREGEDIVDTPYRKRVMPGLFELLRNRPHIQLNTEVDQDDFGGAPAEDRYVRMQHIQRTLGQARSAADYPISKARRILESRIRRFRSAWLNPGMLFLHFSETIAPWDRRLIRHWFLPRGSDNEASRKYDELTLRGRTCPEPSRREREACYYGRVLKNQCGYRVVQYWFFYAFNDFRTAVRGTNNHEGDWERISIYLAQEHGQWRPRYAAYSAHHGKQTRAWEEVECADEAGQHPVVYVARGSHACYFEPAIHRPGVGPFRVKDYALGDGEEIGPGDWGRPRIFTETEPDWLFFDGFWGAYIRDLLMRENAPRGPLYTIEPGFHRPRPRPSWYDPRRWAGLECIGGSACDHQPRGYYSFATTDSAWQEDWGTDEEWDEWAKAAGLE